MAAVTSVMRAQQIYQARVDEVLQPFDLTFARYELLMLLHFSSRGSMPLKKASDRLQVHPTASPTPWTGWRQPGWSRRVPHPTDGRGALVEITDAGRERALASTDALNAEVFADPGLPARRVRTLVSVLTDLRRNAGDFG